MYRSRWTVQQTVYIETRMPSLYKLEICKMIQLTDETVWEPSSMSIASIKVMLDLAIIKISECRKILAISVQNDKNHIPLPEE